MDLQLILYKEGDFFEGIVIFFSLIEEIYFKIIFLLFYLRNENNEKLNICGKKMKKRNNYVVYLGYKIVNFKKQQYIMERD